MYLLLCTCGPEMRMHREKIPTLSEEIVNCIKKDTKEEYKSTRITKLTENE